MDTNGRVRRKHRSWPEALKREIVAAASVPGTAVWDEFYMVFSWRKRDRAAFAYAAPPQLVAVVVTPEQISATPAATLPTEDIEIELPHGTRIRVGAGVNAAALRVVLDALARR